MNCFRNRLRSVAFLAVLQLAGLASVEAGDPIRLTSDGHLKHDPIFIDSGRQIVYTLLETPVQLRLMRLKLADKTAVVLHPNVSRNEFEADFSSDGRYEAFVQSRGNLSLALVIRDTKENVDFEVTPSGGFSGLRSPAISPDMKRVLYCYPEDGRQQIYAVSMQAKDRQALTNSGGVNNWPCFSRDGKQIAFGSTRDGNYDLYLMNADGSSVRRLTTNRFQDIRPSFSPDGKQIAFTSSRDGNYEIYLINTNGTGLKRITNHPERDDYPSWHPDGKKLVIVSEREGRHDLYLIDFSR